VASPAVADILQLENTQNCDGGQMIAFDFLAFWQ
jgi:hypothetical protein